MEDLTGLRIAVFTVKELSLGVKRRELVGNVHISEHTRRYDGTATARGIRLGDLYPSEIQFGYLPEDGIWKCLFKGPGGENCYSERSPSYELVAVS